MVGVIDTIDSIEDRSKRIVFRPIDETANKLNYIQEDIEDELNDIAEVNMDDYAMYSPPDED
jgi:hypothetical protein